MHYPLFRGKTKAKLREVFKEDRLFDFSEVYSGDLNDLVYVECPPREPRSPDAWEYEDISMIMDSLLEAKVYTGKDEETVRHMDAYNTVTNFKRLDAWWEQHRGDYSPKAWLEMAAEWKGNPNSFNRRILGYIIEDKLQAQPA